MEDKEIELLKLDDRDLVVIGEDEEVIYATDGNNPEDVVILKKVDDKIYELNEVERIPYLEKFISEYGHLADLNQE